MRLHAGLPANVPEHRLLAALDTIRVEHSDEAGSAVITTLPAPDGDSDGSYEVIRAPAMSWLVDRSFLWDTRPEDAGQHTFLFRRVSDGQTDTVALSITLTR
jgi:hypothetical protein